MTMIVTITLTKSFNTDFSNSKEQFLAQTFKILFIKLTDILKN